MDQTDPVELSPSADQRSWMSSWVRWKHFPLLCLIIWCLAGVLLRSGPSATACTSSASVSDFMIPISGAWALASGMHIHTDFSTPLGLAYYLPYYWMLKFSGNNEAIVRNVGSAVFVVVSVITFLLFRPPRYSWRITALGVAFVSLMAASPGLIGAPPTAVYEGGMYNFLGIAVSCLCLLTASFPLQGDPAAIRRREIQDALLLAAALVVITFVKINFLAQTGIYLAAAWTVRWITQGRPGWRFPLVLVTGFLVFAALFVLAFQVNLSAMLRDVRMATECRSRWVMTVMAISDGKGDWYTGFTGLYLRAISLLRLVQSELLMLGIVTVGILGAVAALGQTLQRRVMAYVGLMLVILAGDIFQSLFNTYVDALPMLPCFWLLLVCVVERDRGFIRDDATGAHHAHRARKWVGRVALTMVCLHVLFLSVAYVSAFALDTGLSECFGLKGVGVQVRRDEHIQAKGWEHLYFPVPVIPATNNVSYITKLNDGLALLRDHHLDQKRIFVLDFINPFPFLLRAPYPTGQPAWLHSQATFDEKSHLPAETVLKGADVILVPLRPLNHGSKGILTTLYQAYLETNYVQVAVDDHWQLLQRESRP